MQFKERLVEVLESGDSERLAELLASEDGQEQLPEVWALKTLSDDAGDRHKDNFAHTVTVVAQTGPDADLVTRLAALFHDIGKPATRRFEGGKVTFHHHEATGIRLLRRRFAALGFDEQLTEDVVVTITAAARAQSYDTDWTDASVRRLRLDAGDNWDRAIRLAHSDVTSRHAEVHRRVHRSVDGLTAHQEHVAAEDARRAERPAVNGDQLQAAGIAPGPELGRILRWLLEENRAGRLRETDEAIARVLAHRDDAEPPWG